MKFNRSQILGLDIDRHIVLDAGAGTGKTTVMAERYVQHLLSRIQRSTLVLPNATMDTDSLSNNLIFTNKPAIEIRGLGWLVTN